MGKLCLDEVWRSRNRARETPGVRERERECQTFSGALESKPAVKPTLTTPSQHRSNAPPHLFSSPPLKNAPRIAVMQPWHIQLASSLSYLNKFQRTELLVAGARGVGVRRS
jgi:hypothetical protein